MIEFDPAKDAANLLKHGLSLRDFTGFDADPVTVIDPRHPGEVRYRSFGRIGGKGHCIVFTLRPSGIRLISFRRAHEKEMRRYGTQEGQDPVRR